MEMACSPTWFLIATLVAWALIAFLALAGAPYWLLAEQREEPAPSRLRKLTRLVPRHFVQLRASDSEYGRDHGNDA